jgi:uncharacterized protein with von Willebrand factor type A (vWA) domain
LPRAVRPFAEFPAFLRPFGFAVATEQTLAFMAAVTLLGPKSFADIRRAAHATLAPRPERRGDFDALFDAFFLDGAAQFPVPGESDEETAIKGDRGSGPEPPEASREADSGKAATAAELLARRSFQVLSPDQHLVRFVRRAPSLLPRRRAFRRAAAKSGDIIDLRRTMRRALASGGDAPRLAYERRKTRQRNILILIDISGSMKSHTADYLRFAHAATRVADRVETFTFGTRLTRISRAMRIRDRSRALAEAEATVDDWDGGTRIGEALAAFLAVPRFAGYARGALVLVLSDGLERGDPAAMVDAVRRLSRRAWRLAWLTPLAADPGFRPQTQALRAILPLIDDLGSAGSIESLCAYVLTAASQADDFDAARWLRGETT